MAYEVFQVLITIVTDEQSELPFNISYLNVEDPQPVQEDTQTTTISPTTTTMVMGR